MAHRDLPKHPDALQRKSSVKVSIVWLTKKAQVLPVHIIINHDTILITLGQTLQKKGLKIISEPSIDVIAFT